MTVAEGVRYAQQNRLHCIKESCEGHVTQVALTPGWYKECDVCRRRWDFTDPRGTAITREEYDRRQAEFNRKSNISKAEMSDPEEEEKKMPKKSEKDEKQTKLKKIATKPRKDLSPEEYAVSSPRRFTEWLVVTTELGNKEVGEAVAKKFPDTCDSCKNGVAAGVARSAIKCGRLDVSWMKHKTTKSDFDDKPAKKVGKKKKKAAKKKAAEHIN